MISDIETKRIQKRVGRYDGSFLDIIKGIQEERPDIAIVRSKQEDINLIYKWVKENKCTYLYGDCQVFYEHYLNQINYGNEEISVIDISYYENEAIVNLLAESFKNYYNHYCVGRAFSGILPGTAYIDWFKNLKLDKSKELITLGAFINGKLESVIIAEVKETYLDIILNATSPETQKKGLYSSILQKTLKESQKRGLEKVIISSHIHNIAVQRVLQKNNFRIFDYKVTGHILLNGN